MIALLNGQLVDSTDSLVNACMHLLEKAETEDREHITVFTARIPLMNKWKRLLTVLQEYPKHEMEIHEGGQPHYQFILSIE